MVIDLTSEEKEFLKEYAAVSYHRFRELEYYTLLLQKMKIVSESS
ncbi:hypothetical protein [Streptococcus sp. HF-100]|nr:hypothetical protein [Streptococcus sp. HF-100]